ncbi:ECF transporter S component [Guptibacillus algicola]|uniref:ECF transporter S component n=1 Tax=Guptibacillus algicola TaxID=225844 RepID=UPI001CD539C3|nr:ECF transporter S component [Alkalihalobacillus algicola]MCA0989042.1 ECF transporter S component [Alkalihalobacillus algicola]
MKTVSKTQRMIVVAMFSSISYLLMLLDFPLPGFPVFLQIDFSDIPALFVAILYGPVAGILVEAIKNFIHYGIQGSFTGVPIGQLANFIAGIFFIVPTSIIFRKFNQTQKGLTIGLILGTILMSAMMGLLNYLLILPAYTWFMGFEAMSASARQALVLKGITPFNLIKGSIVAGIFIVFFIKLKPWFQKQTRLA